MKMSPLRKCEMFNKKLSKKKKGLSKISNQPCLDTKPMWRVGLYKIRQFSSMYRRDEIKCTGIFSYYHLKVIG